MSKGEFLLQINKKALNLEQQKNACIACLRPDSMYGASSDKAFAFN